MLELYLRWERGQWQWHNPETGRAIMNLPEIQCITEEERQGRLATERREEAEPQNRLEAEQARQKAARVAAERIRELEEKLRHFES